MQVGGSGREVRCAEDGSAGGRVVDESVWWSGPESLLKIPPWPKPQALPGVALLL